MNITDQLNEARLFKQRFKLKEAIESFKKCLEIDAHNLIALSQIGFCSLILGNVNEAEFFFSETFKETKEKDLPVGSYLAAIFVAKGEKEKAQKILDILHAVDPHFSIATTYMLVAEMLSEKKDDEKAVYLIDTLCADFQKDAFFKRPVNHYRIIRILAHAGLIEIAEILADSHEKTVGDSWEGVAAKASVEIGKKDYEKAYKLTITALQRGGGVNPFLAAQQHWLALNK